MRYLSPMLGPDEQLVAQEVGLPEGSTLPFEFRAPAHASPLVISFPHVGLKWPSELGPTPQVNFRRNADYAVDRLYVRAEALGAATLRARYSRLVVDLNRAADDVHPQLVPDHPDPRPRASLSSIAVGRGTSARRPIQNRGVVWRTAVGNIPLLTTLSYANFSARIARYHRPYYAALECLLRRRVERFGYAVLLDAHSMPGTISRDLVLGTRAGQSCAPSLVQLAATTLAQTSPGSFEVSVDDPYQGGEIVAALGRPQTAVHALQLEINRSLYMDEYQLTLGSLPAAAEVSARALGQRAGKRQLDREGRRRFGLVDALDALVRALSIEDAQLTALAAE